MSDNNTVKIQHIEFRKDCAKGMSLKAFKESFGGPAFKEIDLDKAFVILGGKNSKKKEDIKEK